ncbi:hypothetical protein ABZ479_15720 [Streptomyces sp. NPDC005722]
MPERLGVCCDGTWNAAGMVRNCGIPRRDHADRIPAAWALYRSRVEHPNGFDVGGGYQEAGLSDITLLWMVDQARRHGLTFHTDALSAAGPKAMQPEQSIGFRVRPDSSGQLHTSRTGMYRLTKPFHRPLGSATGKEGEPDGDEYLAVSAKERYDRTPGYRPRELERYLADREQVRLEPAFLPGLATEMPPQPSAPQ